MYRHYCQGHDEVHTNICSCACPTCLEQLRSAELLLSTWEAQVRACKRARSSTD